MQFGAGIGFNDLPTWQKRGAGLLWETYEKTAENPITGEPMTATRCGLKVELELPMKGRYGNFIVALL